VEPLLTIAIPFYRGRDYLKQAIESVRAQEQAAWRLLVCDDGGEEPRAGQEIEALVASFRDDRFRYHRNHTGPDMVRNWNRCLELAETDLVSVLHADDQLLPSYTGLMLELAAHHPEATAFYCEARIIDARGRPSFSLADAIKPWFRPAAEDPTILHGEPAVRALMAGNFIMCPTLCLRKSVLKERRFSPEWRQAQDLELTTRLLMDGDSLVGSRRTAYAYRRHKDSATSRQSASMLRFEEEVRLFDLVANRAEALGWREAARISRRKRIVKLHLLYRSLRELAALRPRAAATRLRFLREKC
jgi:glycosyltransferase involved in cell wall biosynthesis